MFLFSYSDIKPGSKIIIYGAGVAGMDFYEQMKVSGYAEVICLADRDYKIWNMSDHIDVPVIGLEDIPDYKNKFDYVIISIRKETVAKKVRDELIKKGIDAESIIIPPDISMHEYLIYRRRKCSIGITDFLEKQKREEILDVWFQGQGSIKYFFEYLILQIKILDKNSEEVLKLKEIIMNENRIDYKIVMIQIMIHAFLMDSGLLSEFMETVGRMEDLEWRYLYLNSIAAYSLFFADSIYSKFYTDLRKEYKELMEEFRLVVPQKEKSHKERIVFLLFPILEYHVHEGLVAGWLNEFEKEFDVYVYFMDIPAAQDNNAYPMPFLCPYMGGLKQYEKMHRKKFGNQVHLEYLEGMSIRDRLQFALNRIFEINPGLIIDITDEYLPLTYLLAQYYPIMYIPMRGFKSSVFFTKILLEGKRAALYANQENPSIMEEQIFECYTRVPKFFPKRTWRKEEFGWSESDFVIVSIGYRLDYEMSEQFMKCVCDLMKEDSGIKWLLIGVESVGYLEMEKELNSNGQIYVAGPQEDLAGICQCCDAYLNPLRTGGGISQRIAVSNGVPVVADGTQWFDEMEILGWDNLCWSVEEQIDKIRKMRKDEEYRKSELRKMQQAVLRCEEIADSDLLLEECKRMINENIC